ncbi:MAG: hypothetical protein QW576_05400 [Candidatus Korarchaeum sp.]
MGGIVWKQDGRNPAIPNPIIPKSNEFKKQLRDELMEDWGYSKHYVDSAIREAYSLLKSWRRNYREGRRKEKPIIKKRFVRVKGTLYSYKEGKIKVSVRPFKEYLVFDISRAWFSRRVRGAGRAHTEGGVPNDDLQVQRKRRKNHWEDSMGLQFEKFGWLQSEAWMDQDRFRKAFPHSQGLRAQEGEAAG